MSYAFFFIHFEAIDSTQQNGWSDVFRDASTYRLRTALYDVFRERQDANTFLILRTVLKRMLAA
jgi:3-phenylpropionate/cinnamic acid dioxygenase small subunit